MIDALAIITTAAAMALTIRWLLAQRAYVLDETDFAGADEGGRA